MPIPDYQSVMLPFLKHVADFHECSRRHAVDAMSDSFALGPEEREQKLPSGRTTTIYSRVGWARVYLRKAGLVERTRRGCVRITDRGRATLAANLPRLDNTYLRQFSEFREFLGEDSTSLRQQATLETVAEVASPRTPEEDIAEAHRVLTEQLASELLSRLREGEPQFFERAVVDVLLAMGYGGSRVDAGRVVGGSGDHGIDGVIQEDRLGLDVIYVQAKRWAENVGRPEIMRFVGALQGKKARKGVFFTTSEFTREALEYADSIDSHVVLIGGRQLTRHMIDYSVGVSPGVTFEIKKLDLDYFEDE